MQNSTLLAHLYVQKFYLKYKHLLYQKYSHTAFNFICLVMWMFVFDYKKKHVCNAKYVCIEEGERRILWTIPKHQSWYFSRTVTIHSCYTILTSRSVQYVLCIGTIIRGKNDLHFICDISLCWQRLPKIERDYFFSKHKILLLLMSDEENYLFKISLGYFIDRKLSIFW